MTNTANFSFAEREYWYVYNNFSRYRRTWSVCSWTVRHFCDKVKKPLKKIFMFLQFGTRINFLTAFLTPYKKNFAELLMKKLFLKTFVSPLLTNVANQPLGQLKSRKKNFNCSWRTSSKLNEWHVQLNFNHHVSFWPNPTNNSPSNSFASRNLPPNFRNHFTEHTKKFTATHPWQTRKFSIETFGAKFFEPLQIRRIMSFEYRDLSTAEASCDHLDLSEYQHRERIHCHFLNNQPSTRNKNKVEVDTTEDVTGFSIEKYSVSKKNCQVTHWWTKSSHFDEHDGGHRDLSLQTTVFNIFGIYWFRRREETEQLFEWKLLQYWKSFNWDLDN